MHGGSNSSWISESLSFHFSDVLDAKKKSLLEFAIRSRSFFIFISTLVSRAIHFSNICLSFVRITAHRVYFTQKPSLLKKVTLFHCLCGKRKASAPNKAQNTENPPFFFFFIPRVVNAFFNNKLRFILI